MKRAGVIGDPIQHSLSPAIFSTIQCRLGILDFAYEPIRVSPEKLPELIRQIYKEGEFLGLNVTLPHKQTILSLLKDISPQATQDEILSSEARGVGAVNVISFGEPARQIPKGHNTDVEGLRASFKEEGVELQGRRVLLLGAGGAARACAYAVASGSCAEVAVVNKTQENSERLVQSMKSLFPSTRFTASPDFSSPFSIVINSTSLGMKGREGDPSFFQKIWSGVADAPSGRDPKIAYDLIYTPENTPFLIQARSYGYRAIGGLGMLIHQAIASWEIWFGPLSIQLKQDLRSELERSLRQILAGIASGAERSQIIFVTGFMGVGKSTIGEHLAKRRKAEFLDTDRWIERMSGKAVAQIFSQEGESAFREWESRAIQEATRDTRGKCRIVALGGGALKNPHHLETILKSGTLIYLSATLEAIVERLLLAHPQKRPLLKEFLGVRSDQAKSGLKSKIRSLLEDRLPHYKKAHIEVSTTHRSLEQIMDEIEKELKSR